jgi:hypothetical protein
MPPGLRVPFRELASAAAAVALAGVMAAGCARSSPATPKPAIPPPFLALRLAFTAAAAGRDAVRYGDTTVFLAPDVLMSDDDVLSVRPGAGPDGGLLLRRLVRALPGCGGTPSPRRCGRARHDVAAGG